MTQIKHRNRHPAEQYARDIIDGRIIACKPIIRACERYFYDKLTGKSRGIYLDEDAAQRVINFIERLCHHSKGEWGGQKFLLEPWQQFFIWNIFGWKEVETGYRRFKTVYLQIARKSGKSTLASSIGLFMLVADGEPGCEVYSAAVKREQALLTHSEATRMVKKSPYLKSQVGIFRHNLHIEKTASKFEPLGRDSDSCDGLNIHGAIVDELHAHKTRDMWDVLETATGSRRQPLQIAITTAGFDRESICYEQYDYLMRILKEFDKPNGYQDDSYFGLIYTLDMPEKEGEIGDDWKDEKVWIKANPNLGVSVKIDDLRRKAKKAAEIPSAVNNFLRKHMDVWVQQSVRAIDMDVWDQNFKYNVMEENLLGRSFHGGVDLSSVSDITAWVMVFPNPNDPEKEQVDILARFWCPQSRLTSKTNRYRAYYEAWHRDGWLKVTPGDAIDYDDVKKQILIDARKFNLIDMGVDRLFQGYQLSMELSKELGTRYVAGKQEEKVAAVGMGYQTMTPAIKEFESRLLKRKINHGNNPVMRWMADNLALREDPAGGKKPDKVNSQGKIDGIIGLLIGIDRLNRQPLSAGGSKYERQDMASV